jgi:hypothetical protein
MCDRQWFIVHPTSQWTLKVNEALSLEKWEYKEMKSNIENVTEAVDQNWECLDVCLGSRRTVRWAGSFPSVVAGVWGQSSLI